MKTSALETVAFSVYLLLDISLGCKTQQTQIKSGRLIQAEIIETKRSGDVFNTPEILNNTVDIGLEIAKNGVGACGEVFRSGFNYYETVVRDEMTATNSESCAKMCKLKPYCNSFSFSNSELILANCLLSELSETNIDVVNDITDDKVWNVFILRDVCQHEDESKAQLIQQLPSNCHCNGFIDLTGGGECRHPSLSGSWWCYVDSHNNDCPDSVPDPLLPQMSRSAIACNTDEECECNPYNISQPGFADLCSGDMFYQTKFCYVTPDSRCGDKRTSRLYPSLYWSTEACGYPSSSSSSTLSLSSSLFHQSWNFSSSYEECAGYCGSRERCEEGNIHVRFDTVNNICMMDSVPVGHLHLDHINPWL